MLADRLTGAALIALGGLLFLVVIPWQVEAVDYGWLRPRTLPNIIAAILALCGLWMIVWPGAEPVFPAAWGRAALFAGMLAAGLWAISGFGFMAVAPVLALALMLVAGERRWVWLAAGALGTPGAIWLFVSVLLERPLP